MFVQVLGTMGAGTVVWSQGSPVQNSVTSGKYPRLKVIRPGKTNKCSWNTSCVENLSGVLQLITNRQLNPYTELLFQQNWQKINQMD